jgi:hypothetical protein
MLRAILLGAVSLTITAGCHRATTSTTGQKAGGTTVGGTVEGVDATGGTLTVKVRRRRQNPDDVVKTFQVEEDTTVTSITGENKKELIGRAALSDAQFKRGSRVSVSTSEDGSKAVSIQVGDLPRRGGNRGGRGGRGPG